jgi:xanthine/uracil permease
VSLFRTLVAAHIATGAVGLALFWVAVGSRKGGKVHRDWGHIFAYSMLVTGCIAAGMGLTTLADPVGTHPHLADRALVTGIFGWMMVYLAVLTISLAWHGLQVVRHKRRHEANRRPRDVALQVVVIIAAVNCAVQGWLRGLPLMMGISLVGIASGGTNLFFSFRAAPPKWAYLVEHMKALVGAGISVYTAFMTFGLVRFMPRTGPANAHAALNPRLWAIPLAIGLSIIFYHHYQIHTWYRRGRSARVEVREA